MTQSAVAPAVTDFAKEVSERLERLLALAVGGGLDEAIGLMTKAIETGAVIQAFGTGHSEAFAMEIAGRAGGLIPTNKIALRDLVLHGSLPVQELSGSGLERNPSIVAELWDVSPIHRGDVFLIASNSGVNGSVVGMALLAKERGHDVIAVTSLQHTAQVQPKHPSGRRLSEIADVVIDNLAPYGDATLGLDGGVAGRRRLLDHERIHRPTADHRRRRADARRGPDAAALPVGQHSRRRRAQPCA